MQTITIEQAPSYIDQEVILRGWLYNKRSSGKIIFLQLRDGTGVIQAVITQPESPEMFAVADQLRRETSIMISGKLREDRRAPSGLSLIHI